VADEVTMGSGGAGGTERDHQVALFQWRSHAIARWPCLRLLHAIPNAGGYRGGYRSNAFRVRGMLQEGVMPGIPDVHLPVAAHGFHGLYIELKRPKGGVVSAPQRAVHLLLEEAGNCVRVCRGWDEARLTIEWYADGVDPSARSSASDEVENRAEPAAEPAAAPGIGGRNKIAHDRGADRGAPA